MSICPYCNKEYEPGVFIHERGGDCDGNFVRPFHGHVLKRPDGSVCECGGPSFCPVCWLELVSLPNTERMEWLKNNDWSDEKYTHNKDKFKCSVSKLER
jgi:hypothetical protein